MKNTTANRVHSGIYTLTVHILHCGKHSNSLRAAISRQQADRQVGIAAALKFRKLFNYLQAKLL